MVANDLKIVRISFQGIITIPLSNNPQIEEVLTLQGRLI